MNSGEGSPRKSMELLIQISSWTGGIFAAAIGGLVYAFVAKDTPPEVIPYFKWVLIPLLLALAATWWLQMHVALHARELEIKDLKAARGAAGASAAESEAVAQTVAADSATNGRAKDKKKKKSRAESINDAIGAQIAFQCVALFTIGFVFVRYTGPKLESWSLVANQSDGRHISYLMKVRMPDAKDHEQSAAQLRLLLSDADGNWRMCTIDPATKDGGALCPSPTGTAAGGPALRLMGAPILFHQLQYKLKYEVEDRTVDLSDDVCVAKKALLEARAGGALVIGSHDRERVLGGANVDTNESLARLRASSVAAFLAEDNACGRAVETVISLNAAPVMATHDVALHSDVSADRSVRIYGLIAKSVVP
jgi:hypothetical protein